MFITVRMAVVLAIVLILFNMYYLEDEIGKEGVYWIYSILGVVFGVISVFAVAKDSPNERSYITLAVLCVLLAILNYGEEEDEEPLDVEEPKKKKRKKPGKKRKNKGKK